MLRTWLAGCIKGLMCTAGSILSLFVLDKIFTWSISEHEVIGFMALVSGAVAGALPWDLLSDVRSTQRQMVRMNKAGLALHAFTTTWVWVLIWLAAESAPYPSEHTVFFLLVVLPLHLVALAIAGLLRYVWWRRRGMLRIA